MELTRNQKIMLVVAWFLLALLCYWAANHIPLNETLGHGHHSSAPAETHQPATPGRLLPDYEPVIPPRRDHFFYPKTAQ